MKHILNPSNWVLQYADFLFGHAFFSTNDTQDAEDLVQETFLSAYKSRETFKGDATEKTWLTSILKNKIIDYYRKNAVNAKAFDSDASESLNYFFCKNDNEDSYKTWNPQSVPKTLQLDGLQALEQKELHAFLILCFNLLPIQWRGICKNKLIEHETTEIICKQFNITPSNFWVILHRAKLHLRECLQNKWLQNA
jgi:RNA polymerase sigma factor (sigma-70 family)